MAPSQITPLAVLALSLFLTFTTDVEAQHMNAKDAPCQSGPNSEQTRCLIEETHNANRDLNLAYQKILAKLSPIERAKLQQAQRLWVRFRDANCAAEQELYDGAPMVQAACEAADTRQRTAELNLMYGWRLTK